MAEQDDGHWLDIQVHKKVHKTLSTWGKRLGLTPEGFAKMLLLQAMHPLLAAEGAERAKHVRKVAPEADAPDAGELARKMWQNQIDQYAGTPDLMPAPSAVAGTVRLYHADNFRWPEHMTPPMAMCQVDGDKVIAVGNEQDGKLRPEPA